jgi:hypothetical protein
MHPVQLGKRTGGEPTDYVEEKPPATTIGRDQGDAGTTSPILGPSTPRRPPSATTTVRWCGVLTQGRGPQPSDSASYATRRQRVLSPARSPTCHRPTPCSSKGMPWWFVDSAGVRHQPVAGGAGRYGAALSVHRRLACRDCPTRPKWRAVSRTAPCCGRPDWLGETRGVTSGQAGTGEATPGPAGPPGRRCSRRGRRSG